MVQGAGAPGAPPEVQLLPLLPVDPEEVVVLPVVEVEPPEEELWEVEEPARGSIGSDRPQAPSTSTPMTIATLMATATMP